MKCLSLALLLLSSVSQASGTFSGVWSGTGTFKNASGIQSCSYSVELDQALSEVTVEYVKRTCDSQVETYYGYISSGGTFYDQFGNSVGTLTANTIQIRIESSGYVDDTTFQLENGQLYYSEHYDWETNPSINFDATATLSPTQN
jgi:hypothetical protein